VNTITTTQLHLQAAFSEWDRRYRADPEAFMNEAARLLNPKQSEGQAIAQNPAQDEYTYGEAAAPYFLSILEEVE
jgi:hypothetical protein